MNGIRLSAHDIAKNITLTVRLPRLFSIRVRAAMWLIYLAARVAGGMSVDVSCSDKDDDAQDGG